VCALTLELPSAGVKGVEQRRCARPIALRRPTSVSRLNVAMRGMQPQRLSHECPGRGGVRREECNRSGKGPGHMSGWKPNPLLRRSCCLASQGEAFAATTLMVWANLPRCWRHSSCLGVAWTSARRWRRSCRQLNLSGLPQGSALYCFTSGYGAVWPDWRATRPLARPSTAREMGQWLACHGLLAELPKRLAAAARSTPRDLYTASKLLCGAVI
jgi:hypothetical protein